MKIIIVGIGMVGYTLVERLSSEKHDIVVVDEDEERIRSVSDEFDCMGVIGNGGDFKVLVRADVEKTDLLIAVTESDEQNLLCCIMARRFENCRVIARVRNPIYTTEIGFLRRELGLSMVINPENIAAQEMARIIQYPPSIRIDTFTRGRIELMHLAIEENNLLNGFRIREIRQKLKCRVLICIVTRGEKVFVPGVDEMLLAGDKIVVAATPAEANDFFEKIGVHYEHTKSVMIVGGGRTGYYLGKRLVEIGIHTKIIEQDKNRCDELTELLPQAEIIHGDGTNEKLLVQEGIAHVDAFAALTGMDEENVFMSLAVKNHGKARTITKIKRISYTEVINKMELDAVVFPRMLTADYITKYAASMTRNVESGVENIFPLEEGRAEAYEFFVREASDVTDTPICELKIKPDLLLCSITRNGRLIIPTGDDEIRVGDAVIAITTRSEFNDIKDIVRR
ncbi:MAG: Trk system potassium transporter TrkA [Lachnospiraceae bacterium]|nr:Trk system potassium transporter TrkA [Lachnospiraceae bacterium]